MDIGMIVYATGLELLLPIVGAGMSLYGTATQYQAQRAAAEASLNASKAEAEMMKQKGAEEMAVSQREAQQQARKTQAVQDRARAVAAAGGGGTGGSALNIIADLGVAGKEAEQEIYRQGAQRQRDYGNKASVGVQQAKAEYKGAKQSAFASALGNVGGTLGGLYSNLRRG